ncbi:MAG: hypothetical protein JST54_22310, partial [Deltaproteobacteria bacterium]|nr:hypothetical protein [Deltaproteobacteria bacterium]
MIFGGAWLAIKGPRLIAKSSISIEQNPILLTQDGFPGPKNRLVGLIDRLLGPMNRLLGPMNRLVGPMNRLVGP